MHKCALSSFRPAVVELLYARTYGSLAVACQTGEPEIPDSIPARCIALGKLFTHIVSVTKHYNSVPVSPLGR